MENRMAQPEVYSDFEKFKKIQHEFDSISKDLDKVNTRWEAVATSIDALSEKN
jgi:hypothetical protein